MTPFFITPPYFFLTFPAEFVNFKWFALGEPIAQEGRIHRH